MTPAQLEHLKLAAKRTPGEWDHGYGNALVVHKKTDYTVASTSSGEVVAEDCPIIPWQEQVANSEYIASCAGNAEAGWRATRAAIELLLLQKELGEEFRFGHLLTDILATFPLELVKP